LVTALPKTHAAMHSTPHNGTQAYMEHLPAAKHLAYQPANIEEIKERGMYRFRVATGAMVK
jgi:hypothetical protein